MCTDLPFYFYLTFVEYLDTAHSELVILYDDTRLFSTEFAHGKTKRLPAERCSDLDQKACLLKKRFVKWSKDYIFSPGRRPREILGDSVDSLPVDPSYEFRTG